MSVTLWTAASDDRSTVVTLSTNPVVALRVDELRDGFIYAEAPLTGRTVRIPIRNQATGFVAPFVSEPGLYVVPVSGLASVTFTLNSTSNNVSTATVDLLTELPDLAPYAPPVRPVHRRVPLPLTTSRIRGAYAVRELGPDGKVYAVSGLTLRSSTDWGSTFPTLIHTFTATGRVGTEYISAVRKLASGKLLVTTNAGQLFVSDTSEANFTLILDIGASGSGLMFTEAFGLTAWQNLIAVAEYGNQGYGVAIHAYLSNDGGATFNQFFTAPAPTGYHNHDIAYDPYEDLFWICGGDGTTARAIYFSPDRGVTWFRAQPAGKAPLQASQILPLPECVLFVGDDWRVGVLRYDRPPGGTPRRNDALNFDVALVAVEEWNGDAVPIAIHGCVTHGDANGTTA
jgi:hypothetical protein